MSLSVLFMLSQGLGSIPALPAGTTVMVVAEDLRTIYATGVVDGGSLMFDRALPPGEYLQLVIYPAQNSVPGPALHSSDRPAGRAGEEPEPAMPAPTAQAESSFAPSSLRVRVSPDGRDLFLLVDNAGGEVSLGDWLSGNRGLQLVVPAP